MSDNSVVATKEDIKMLFEANKQDIQMIMDAMNIGFKDLKTEIIEEVDKKFKAMDSKFEEKFKESHRHTAILIEDLEDRLLGTNHDVIALHDDKLENHEKRVSKLETQMLYAVS